MAKTRLASRRSASARRSYRRRVKSSHCRGKGPAVCRSKSGCKYTRGKKRSFCRKSRNTKRRRGGGKTRKHGAGGIIGNALVPFGLWGAKSYYSKRKN